MIVKPGSNRRVVTRIAGALGAAAVVVSLSAGGVATVQRPAGDVPHAVSAEGNADLAMAESVPAGGPWDVPALPPDILP
jgi:hypothetical protein